ncbi:MAG: hypothetical protein RL259_1326, partial [Bacteroidota bacterium]
MKQLFFIILFTICAGAQNHKKIIFETKVLSTTQLSCRAI